MGRSIIHRVPDAETAYLVFTIAAVALCLAFLDLDFTILKAQSFAAFAFDPSGYPIGRDFLNTWMGARSAFAGGPAPWFDFAAYNAALRDVTGHPDFPLHFWSYPPHLLIITWPLGFLPFLPAYALWCAGGLALFLFAARAGGIERAQTVFLAAAPAVLVNVFYGQNGFLTAALLIGGLAQLDRRPALSGILFGILSIKPQLGLLVPVLLVLTARWRVAAAAIATTIALAAVTSFWFGPDVWIEYIRKVAPQQHWLLQEAGDRGWTFVASAFVNARLAGLSANWAWVVQGVSSTLALAMVVWTFWRKRDPVLSVALFVTASFLFSPWMLNYDMVVFGWIVALMRQRTDNTAADHVLALAIWTLPLTMWVFGAAHIPIAMIVLPAFAGRIVWRLRRTEVQAASDGLATASLGALVPQ